ncbi:MAG: hypothetical protein C4575_12890 [Desulforudis sp.]|jgi:hypothetical protein|nr:MAG: hypothetical protein C4575_12890 [Desulforudis sp.]
MTALTVNKDRPFRAPSGGLETMKVQLAGYTNRGAGNVAFTCFKGAVIACDVSDTDGYFGPMDFSAATGDLFGGIAMEKQAVTSVETADGSVELTVAKNGVWAFPKASLAITDLGAVIYATDTDAVTTTSTNAMAIGILEDIDDTYAWINIEDYFMRAIA